MAYVSKAARQRAQQREQWMTLAAAQTHVRDHDECSPAKALKQLSEALADRQIPVKWDDDDVPGEQAPSRATKWKPGPEDKGKLVAFRAKWERQRAELRTAGYMDGAIEEITRDAYRRKITPALAAAVHEAVSVPPRPASPGMFKPPTINPARILYAPVFWRETRYRRGKVLDPTCDRWRVPLLDRPSVLRLWPTDAPDGAPTPGPKGDNSGGANVIAFPEVQSRGGRPSARDEILQMLDTLSREDHHVRTMDPTKVAAMVAKRCGRTLTEAKWKLRTVLQHIQAWRSDCPD